jgi:hypothetical protein
MQSIDWIIAIAQLRVRLELLQRHPELLEGIDMTPKLAGLALSLATLRHSLEGQAADLMNRADAVNARIATAMTKAKAQMAVTEQAATDIEEFANSLEGANGGPSLSDSSDTSGQSQEPERLSVNGVAQG